MKKLIALFIALSLALASLPAFAQNAYSELSFELSGLGIISEEKSEEDIVTRGEFAAMTASLIGMTSAAESMGPFTKFTDVSVSAPYASAVNLLSHFGIINGVSEGKFAPESALSGEQAVKVIATCLGYEPIAENSGGWSTGYISVAMKNGLLKGVGLSNPMKRKDLYKLLVNALDMSIIDRVLGKENIYEKTGDTLREVIMNSSGSKIHYLKGVVEANSYSYISSPIEKLYDDEIVIDSVVYKKGTSPIDKFLGHSVEFFAREKDGTFTILSVKEDKKEESVIVKREDFLSKSGENFYYEEENGKRQNLKITSQTKVIYNGTRIKYPDDALFDIKEGSFTLIDHDGNKTVDVLFIDEYVSLMASAYSEGLIVLWDNTRHNGKNHIYVDPLDKTRKMLITDENGKALESFDNDSIVSVFESKNSSRIKVVVSNKSLQGSLDGIDEENITIDGIEYPADFSSQLDLKLGEKATFFLNFEGKVSYAKKEDIELYGYILNVAREKAYGALKVKMLLAGGVDFGVDINEENVNDTNQVPFLIAQNKEISVMEFADRVRFDGTSYSHKELEGKISGTTLVRYYLTEDGKINKIESLEKFGGDSVRRSKYNVYEMVFGGSELFDGFAINNDTKVICIPNSSTCEDDYFVKVNITEANNTVGYLVTGYDFDTDTKKAKVLLIFADMDSDLVRPVDIFANRASLVKSVKYGFNEEKNDHRTIYEIISGSETHSLISMQETASNAILKSLNFADLICYEENNNGEIENAVKIRGLSTLQNDIRTSSSDGYTETYGSVTAREYDEVDSLNYVLVTELKVFSGGVEYTFKIPQRNKPPVYIYDRTNKTVEPGALSDIIPGHDKAYIMERSGSGQIRALVLVR